MTTSINDYANGLLRGELFLEQFSQQLQALYYNDDFMKTITDIYAKAEVSCGNFTAEKDLAKKALYESNAYFNFPEYRQIADTVKDQGYAKNSAAISIYCVMRMAQEGLNLGFSSVEDTASLQNPQETDTNDMDAERWNEICFLVNRYRTSNATERDFQIEAENIFEKLGWSRFKNEIVSQVTIPVGSAQSVRPDIIVRDNEINTIVVELKKPNAGISARNVDQLFSYMRLLKLDYGLLIGDTLQLYYDDPDTMDQPIQVMEVPFIANSSDGIDFCKIISRESFSLSRLQEFVTTIAQRASLEEQSDELFKLLSSTEGASLIRQALFQFFCEKYSPDVVNRTLDRIKIGTKLNTQSETYSPVQPSTRLSDGASEHENHSLKVGQLANQVLRTLLEKGAASKEEIRRMQEIDYSKKVFDLTYPLLVTAEASYDKRRYYAKPLTIDGRAYMLCSQWFETPSNNDRPYLQHWINTHQESID